MNTADRPRLWAAEAAKYLRVSRSTLSKWRMNGKGPQFHRCGPRLIYYFRDEIDQWLEECDGEHCVTVCDDGFEYQGFPYKSLSAAARAITGTRWNGWLFFGLKNRGGRA